MNKILKFFKNRLLRYIPDKLYLELIFHRRMGYWINWNNPQSFNEKIQWLKLYDRRPEYTQLVDKIEVKKYVESIIGKEYIIPTIGIYKDVDEINFDDLPNQFVIKCNHDSGGVIICSDKKKFDYKNAINKLANGLKRDFYYSTREYPYKNINRRLIAEEYIAGENGELKDYKIFCFDGHPKMLFVASDRQKNGEETKFDFYDLNWNHIPVLNGHPCSNKKIQKPNNYEKMLELASKLSNGIPHVRVDFYNINGRIYFGELTFYHWSGFVPFKPEKWDYIFGQYLTLPKEKYKKTADRDNHLIRLIRNFSLIM